MRIARVGVVGAGAMGTGIAALAASAGFPVDLLDVPDDPDRDGRARRAIERALRSRPPAFMDPDCAARITIGNTEDHLDRLAACDWIVEAIVEQPEPKRSLFARLDGLVKLDAIVSSNTSGIPIGSLAVGRSEAFRHRFLGTHFFNPVRHLHLLELIPTADTLPDVVNQVRDVAERLLGKGVIVARDVPGFIANRIGIHGMFRTVRLMQDFGLGIDEVDALTGPHRPAEVRNLPDRGHLRARRAHRRLGRAVGIDRRGLFPAGLGARSRQAGTARREERGGLLPEGWQADPDPGLEDRRVPAPVRTGVPGAPVPHARTAAGAAAGHRQAGGTHAEFLRAVLLDLADYTLSKTLVIAYDLASVDRALQWGFAWELGPFAMFDALGIDWLRSALVPGGAEPSLLHAAREDSTGN